MAIQAWLSLLHVCFFHEFIKGRAVGLNSFDQGLLAYASYAQQSRDAQLADMDWRLCEDIWSRPFSLPRREGMKGVADRAGGAIGGHVGFAMQASFVIAAGPNLAT